MLYGNKGSFRMLLLAEFPQRKDAACSLKQAKAWWEQIKDQARQFLINDEALKRKLADKEDVWKHPEAIPEREAEPFGRHKPTADDIIDLWQKAQILPEPERVKAIQQVIQLSKEFESRPAGLIANILLEKND